MSYIKDDNKLRKVAGVLSAHGDFSREFFYSHLKHQIPRVGDPKDKLTSLFVVSNSQRQGRNREETGIKASTTYFYQEIGKEIKKIENLDPDRAHRHFLQWLCNIPGVEQKTANLFLKWLVMFDSDFKFELIDWQIWKPYLHIPLDRWVIRLLHKKYLNLCTDQYEKDFITIKGEPNFVTLSINKEKYWELQDELRRMLLPSKQLRIVLDNLWFVGFLFCAARPLLCKVCWLYRECEFGRYNSLDLGKMPPAKSKLELKEEKRREMKRVREWISQNPEEAEELTKQLELQSNNHDNRRG